MSAEHRDERSDARLEHGAQPAAKVDQQPEPVAQPEAQPEPQAPAVDPAMQSPVAPTPVEPVSTTVATATPFADAVAEARATVVAPVAETVATPTVPAVPAVPAEGATAAVPAAPALPAVPATPVAGAVEQATTTTDADAPVATTTDEAAPAEIEAPADGAEVRPGKSGEAPGHQADARPDGKPSGEKPGGTGPVNANASDPNANANARAFETPSRTGVTPSRTPETAPVTEPAAPAPSTSTTTSATSAAPQTEAAPATSAPAPVRGATTLQHLARTVDAAMQMGHARGITRARLHLHPAELGAIELHLRHTANGMTARVVAESPEAVAVLQQASNDLRRSLEQAGITLTGLDIGSRADQQGEQRTFAGAFDASDRDRDRGSNGRRYGLNAGDETDTDTVQTIRTRVPLAGGALVDVIA